MPVTKKRVTTIAKLIRASKLCSKAIGIVKLLTNKVRKRSVSCPLPVEACPRLVFKTVLVLDCVEHCFPERRLSCSSPSPPERTVLVLDCVEHSFPERRQSSTRHALMHALADRDPSCENSEYDDSSESALYVEISCQQALNCSPPRPPNFGPSCRGAALAHNLRREILTTEEAIKRNADHIDFVRNCESERGTNYPWTNCFKIGSKILIKNKRLLAETLLILTAALKDIPDNLRTSPVTANSSVKV